MKASGGSGEVVGQGWGIGFTIHLNGMGPLDLQWFNSFTGNRAILRGRCYTKTVNTF